MSLPGCLRLPFVRPLLLITGLLATTPALAQVQQVEIISDAQGHKLQVDGKDFMVLGMNWDYFPIGTNYNYSLWTQSDEFIIAALAMEMPLLRRMGVNAIRQYNGVPPRWVKYIYETYGIYTILNHAMARYGYLLDGQWIPSVDYSDPRLRTEVTAEIVALVEEFKDTPGVLMWLLGNENNYGLSWNSNEIQALPEGERDAARAKHLYSLFGEVTAAIKEVDTQRPVSIANGDLQYIDLIVQECSNIDILGSNVYRGISARDFYQEVKDKLGIPTLFTEFGADAFNAKTMREDQIPQAKWLLGQWQEIYEQSYGKGLVGNCIGGLTFQWSDGWWKYKQTENLDVHDANASWPNGGYPWDYVEGENNMNEEWWGICAKGPSDSQGLFEVFPRAAFFALKDAYELDPYGPDTDLGAIRAHFGAIDPAYAALQARSSSAALKAEEGGKVRVTNVRIDVRTYSTGGSNTSIPDVLNAQPEIPSFLGFDHMESFYTDFEVKPSANLRGTLSLNILGHVAVNPIDQIFYENRGRIQTITDENGDPVPLEGIERVKVYRSTVDWEDQYFNLHGFYRTGMLHWQYEGDFFGLRRDAYYGPNIDIYNGEAPIGVEIEGKKTFNGFKLAFGPQLWWGANPSIMLKYQRNLGGMDWTAIFQEDLAQQGTATSSAAIPQRETRKLALSFDTNWRGFNIQAGGIWSGSPDVGEAFQILDERDGETVVLEDTVKGEDTLGGKAKITYETGGWHWYAQGALLGLVARTGPTEVKTFTDWSLKDPGNGNAANFLTGFAYNFNGSWQIAPNFMWQKPHVDPIPAEGVPAPARPRDIINDPFSVRGNREMVAGEAMLVYDPTGATWFWEWDNDAVEDSKLAWSLGYVFRHLPTTQDAGLGILADGTIFAFPGAPPARDLWEVNGRVKSRLTRTSRIIGGLYFGTAEPDGNDPRKINRFGADLRVTAGRTSFETFVKFNDWGPYDFHRNFNLTFPFQVMGDISYALGAPRWFTFDNPQTRIGIRTTYRTLDQYSPRYCPGIDPETGLCDPTLPGENGNEWEIRTYMTVSL